MVKSHNLTYENRAILYLMAKHELETGESEIDEDELNKQYFEFIATMKRIFGDEANLELTKMGLKVVRELDEKRRTKCH